MHAAPACSPSIGGKRCNCASPAAMALAYQLQHTVVSQLLSAISVDGTSRTLKEHLNAPAAKVWVLRVQLTHDSKVRIFVRPLARLILQCGAGCRHQLTDLHKITRHTHRYLRNLGPSRAMLPLFEPDGPHPPMAHEGAPPPALSTVCSPS